MSTDTTVDDFWTRQAQLPIPHARPITCLICKRVGQAPDHDRPELCVNCGRDIPAARAHVVTMVLRCEMRAERAADAVALATDVLPADVRARYDAYNTAVIASDPRAEQVEALARSGRDEPLLNYIRLWLEYTEADAAAREANEWSVRCEGVLG